MLHVTLTIAELYIYNYTGAIAARGRLLSDDTARPVIIRAVNCTGVETTLYGCSLMFVSAQSCAVDQGVTCQGQTLLQCLVYVVKCAFVCMCVHACVCEYIMCVCA